MALIQDFTYSLAANKRVTIQHRGRSLRVQTAPSGISVSPENDDCADCLAGQGVVYEQSFDNWTLQNGATPQTVTVFVGDGQIVDSRLYGSVAATVTPGSTITTVADVTVATAATSNIAANANRRAATVQALSTNTG